MRPEFMTYLGRALAVLGVLVLVGTVLRLVAAVLQATLPTDMWQSLGGGWATLMQTVGPALGPLGALFIITAICWVVASRRR